MSEELDLTESLVLDEVAESTSGELAADSEVA